jgi:16S rRNA processing protein RimM
VKKRIKLGHVAGVHGVKGWVKIHSLTDPRAAIFDYQPWLLGDTQKPVRYSQAKEHGKRLIALFENVNDREQAEALVNREIWVYREQLPETATGTYYWADLVGLTVSLEDGRVLGKVSHLMDTGANDVLVVDAQGSGNRQHLVPFVQGQYVKHVDLDKGVLVVDWDPDF